MTPFHRNITLAAGLLGLGLWSPVHAASPCDLNNDALTNVSDVQLCANQAIGITVCTNGDITLDGTCNVIDVQRVANAALGGSCVSPAGSETIWVEDALPASAVPVVFGGDSWNWINADPAPYSGSLAHRSEVASGLHQHYFTGTGDGLPVNLGDSLFTYVYLDPLNPPTQVMLQWYDGSWEHRAYWGANQIGYGTDGAASRYPMGPLPALGQWVKLTVPASVVGLEGRTLTGMAFALYGGRATWDRTGKSGGVSNPPPPATTTRGPQSTITCPAGSININPGTNNVQAVVNAYPGNTTFCLKAGVFSVTTPITPKTGNLFVGEYGAILDGTGWTTTDTNQGAFRAHNEDVDDVTIRNLVIRDMPMKAIHAFRDYADRWTIEYNELVSNKYGVTPPNNSVVRNNYIHHNVGDITSQIEAEKGGGYTTYKVSNTVFSDNEIAYNGSEQKIFLSPGVTFRRNFVHHNIRNGIWYDGGNPDALIEDNVVEDHSGEGIFHELSNHGIIRNNTVRRSSDHGIFISNSQNVEIYGNQLEDNYRGINFFIDCDRIAEEGGLAAADLANNNAHDNTVKVGAASGALANLLGIYRCTSTQLAPYTNGSKNLVFQNNHYHTPNNTGVWWYWGGVSKTWSGWQALGNDTTGSIQVQ